MATVALGGPSSIFDALLNPTALRLSEAVGRWYPDSDRQQVGVAPRDAPLACRATGDPEKSTVAMRTVVRYVEIG